MLKPKRESLSVSMKGKSHILRYRIKRTIMKHNWTRMSSILPSRQGKGETEWLQHLSPPGRFALKKKKCFSWLEGCRAVWVASSWYEEEWCPGRWVGMQVVHPERAEWLSVERWCMKAIQWGAEEEVGPAYNFGVVCIEENRTWPWLLG